MSGPQHCEPLHPFLPCLSKHQLRGVPVDNQADHPTSVFIENSQWETCIEHEKSMDGWRCMIAPFSREHITPRRLSGATGRATRCYRGPALMRNLGESSYDSSSPQATQASPGTHA